MTGEQEAQAIHLHYTGLPHEKVAALIGADEKVAHNVILAYVAGVRRPGVWPSALDLMRNPMHCRCAFHRAVSRG